MSAVPDRLAHALSLLPHGPEFRFVDRLLSLVPGKSGVAEFEATADDYCVRDTISGEEVFPTMLLVEAGAQLAGVVAQNDPGIEPLARLRLTALRACKVLGPVRVGEMIRVEASVSGRLGSLVQAEASVFVGNVLVMTFGLTLSGTGRADVDKQAFAGS